MLIEIHEKNETKILFHKKKKNTTSTRKLIYKNSSYFQFLPYKIKNDKWIIDSLNFYIELENFDEKINVDKSEINENEKKLISEFSLSASRLFSKKIELIFYIYKNIFHFKDNNEKWTMIDLNNLFTLEKIIKDEIFSFINDIETKITSSLINFLESEKIELSSCNLKTLLNKSIPKRNKREIINVLKKILDLSFSEDTNNEIISEFSFKDKILLFQNIKGNETKKLHFLNLFFNVFLIDKYLKSNKIEAKSISDFKDFNNNEIIKERKKDIYEQTWKNLFLLNNIRNIIVHKDFIFYKPISQNLFKIQLANCKNIENNWFVFREFEIILDQLDKIFQNYFKEYKSEEEKEKILKMFFNSNALKL